MFVISSFKKSFLLLFIFSTLCFSAQNIEKLGTQKIISNLNGVIWSMTFINKENLLITLKSGKIKRINIKSKKVSNIKGVTSVLYEGQGGLLDIVKSPNFKTDNYLYFTYVKNVNNYGVTTLARAKLFEDTITQWEDLLVTQSATSTSRHFGSRITFDKQGHIFFTIGDRGVRPNAQNLNNHAGSAIRLNPDGTIPKDNPFINNKNALPEIYSYGHRNPQGIFYDKKRDLLFLVEHGPRGGDEINIIQKGKNYGWPVISYGKEYWNPLHVGEGTHKKGMKQPIKVYIPSIAPSSLMVYYGDKYESLNGKILVGALKLQHINVLTFDKNLQTAKETTRLFENLNERIRCIIQDDDNVLYFSTDSGSIYKIVKKY